MDLTKNLTTNQLIELLLQREGIVSTFCELDNTRIILIDINRANEFANTEEE